MNDQTMVENMKSPMQKKREALLFQKRINILKIIQKIYKDFKNTSSMF